MEKQKLNKHIDYAQKIKYKSKKPKVKNGIYLAILWIVFILSIVVAIDSMIQIYGFQVKAFILIGSNKDTKQAVDFYLSFYSIIKWILWICEPILIGFSIASLILTKKTIQSSQNKAFIGKKVVPISLSIVIAIISILFLNFYMDQIANHSYEEQIIKEKTLSALFCLLIIAASVLTITPTAKLIFKSPNVENIRKNLYVWTFAVSMCYWVGSIMQSIAPTISTVSIMGKFTYYSGIVLEIIGAAWFPLLVVLLIFESLYEEVDGVWTIKLLIYIAFALILSSYLLSFNINWKILYTTSTSFNWLNVVRCVINLAGVVIFGYLSRAIGAVKISSK